MNVARVCHPMRGVSVSVGMPGVVLVVYDGEYHGYNWQWREKLGLLMTTDEAICTCTITASLLNTEYQMMLGGGWCGAGGFHETFY